MTITTTVTVEGMTCGHCVNAVESELAAIAGVTDVRVDLATGVVDITSTAGLDRSAIAGRGRRGGLPGGPMSTRLDPRDPHTADPVHHHQEPPGGPAPHDGHTGHTHDKHAGHDPEMFRRRFWLSLA